ncbi:MAG: hypothetical protein ACRC6V_02250 [Bacteroidales bacterium]
MTQNAYLSRLNQLRDKRVEENVRKVQPMVRRPLSKQAPGPGVGPGPARPEEKEEQGPDMGSMFGRNIESFGKEDLRFGKFMKEYGELANGLRQEVEQGYMPMPIAQQRLQSYLQDSAGFFQRNKAGPMDNPEVAEKMEGLLAQATQGQLPEQQAAAAAQPGPAQAMTPQEAPQGGM